MEPETHDDIWKNSLQVPLRSRIASGLKRLFCGQRHGADLLTRFPLSGPRIDFDAEDAAGQAR